MVFLIPTFSLFSANGGPTLSMYGLVGCGWSSGATWCQNSLRLSASGALAGFGARPDEPFDHIWTYLALALSLKQPEPAEAVLRGTTGSWPIALRSHTPPCYNPNQHFPFQLISIMGKVLRQCSTASSKNAWTITITFISIAPYYTSPTDLSILKSKVACSIPVVHTF